MISILNSVAKHMKIDFEEISSKVNHRGEKGTIREEDFMNYMRQFIPARYNMTKGEIVCAGEKHSRQIDCIIYDGLNTPILIDRESSKIIPIESVFITIEIKSYLNKESLKECIENIKSVRKLPKNPITTHFSYVGGFVFAYTSDSLDTILEHFKEYNKGVEHSQQISAICVLDKGLIVNVEKANIMNISLLPTKSTIPIIAKNTDDSTLLLFYLLIMQYLNQTIVSPPDLIQYAKTAGLYNIDLQTNIFKLPEGVSYDGIDMELIKEFYKVNELMKKFNEEIASIEQIESFIGKYIPLLFKLCKNKELNFIICGLHFSYNNILEILNKDSFKDIIEKIYEKYLEMKSINIEFTFNC